MARLLKCYQKRPDCFAVTDDGKCMLLQSYVRNGGIRGEERRYGTKFKGGCPVCKGHFGSRRNVQLFM